MRSAHEGIGEALTGERTGQPLSRESTLIPGADVVPVTEGNTDGRDKGRGECESAKHGPGTVPGNASAQTRRGLRHWHVRTWSASASMRAALVRVGKARSRSR
jgi:hypothetical protein